MAVIPGKIVPFAGPKLNLMATFPVLQPSAAATAKPSSGPAPKRADDCGLLIYDRYTNIFEAVPPSRIPEDSVRIGPDEVLFLVEAPLNSVELFEALLKPARPFEVHTARLIPRKTRAYEPRRQLVDEYLTGQGRLAGKGPAAEREVSFIVLPRDAIWQLQMFNHFLWPVQLQYMSLPVRMSDQKTVRSPYALVCYQAHRVYHKKLKALLRDQKLSDCGFERSLLRPGAAPLPETLREYMDGEPGKDAATPYYSAEPGAAQEERSSRLRKVTSTMSLRRAVSRVSLRRSQSVASITTRG
ncbi:hypothetical protein INS49_000805 [Diaporthe citri]|uniref:uncharacterized protein n=1 Tax=Diaporthe citri TaxID=83186 RepID=UPI001C80097C|nr:uncharacterized protein INS49_000805 [Diaporthe citri]KAG6366627.1 hypothetical protein INS49_000805 [Diaporthe citri]